MDIALNYIEKGIGEPLILLHGNGERWSYFKYQIDFFATQYRVIAIDTRGHGQSPRGEAPFTIHQFAKDLYDFMQEKAIDKAHLLGFSDGGNIALTFVLQHPEKVGRLILNGANLSPSGVKGSIQFPIVCEYYIKRLFSKKDPETKKKVELLGLMVNEPHIDPKELAKVHCQTLVIAGYQDMIKEKHTRLIHRSLPNAQLILLPGDHFIARRNADAFNQAVAQFLGMEIPTPQAKEGKS